jgi:uncharacterized protein
MGARVPANERRAPLLAGFARVLAEKGMPVNGTGRGLKALVALLALCPAHATVAAEADAMTTVYLVLLKKGPSWTADSTPATQAIQEAHMANIRAMWKAQKLIIAGPVEDKGDLRGIFVFQAASLDDARALAATDPAVKAGRLAAEVYPWWVAKGALPQPGTYCNAQAAR